MAKRAKRAVLTASEQKDDTVSAEASPVALERNQDPLVTFAHGDRVEVTVSGDSCRRLIGQLIGCDVPAGVARIDVTRPASDSVTVTLRCHTAASATELICQAASVRG